MNCPHCQQTLPADHSAANCPSCGAALPSAQAAGGAPETSQPSKRIWWLTFAIAFLGSPVLAFLSSMSRAGSLRSLLPPFIARLIPRSFQSLMLVSPIPLVVFAGALVSGYALARIFAKSRTGVWIGTLLLTLGVLVVYVGIVFVGCVLSFKGV